MRLLELYNFDELSTTVQQKLIDCNRDILFQFGIGQDIMESMKAEHRNRLEKIGFQNATIEFALKTGACFTCESIDAVTVLKHYDEFERFDGGLAEIFESMLIRKNTPFVVETNVLLSTNQPVPDHDFYPAMRQCILDCARMEMRNIYKTMKAERLRLNGDDAVHQALSDAGYEYTINGDKVEIE